MSKAQEVSTWSGIAAGFGSLLAIGIFDLLDANQGMEYLGALIVAAVTGSAVYARERVVFAKERKNGPGPTT